MSKKVYNITLIIGIILGLSTLVAAFFNIGVAFILMFITGAYAGCLENEWRDTYFRGFEEK